MRYNTVMEWFLRSPLHGLLDSSFMLITVTGMKSGKAFTLPVNYSRAGDTLTIVSLRNRTWWRNLRGGRPATICLQGKNLPVVGTVIEDDTDVTTQLAAYLSQHPQVAKYFQVTLDSNSQPKIDEVAQTAKNRVIVQIKLGESQ